MPRPTRALVDLGKLRRNYQRAASLAAPARAIAVVKANGYGHGAGPVARALSSLVPMFAVALVEEADVLREQVDGTSILLLQGVHDPADWSRCGPAGFIPVIHSPEQVASLAAAELTTETPVWIKVNTGMNRLGFRPHEIAGVLDSLRPLPRVRVEGLMTHFACADDRSSSLTARQVAAMEELQAQHPELAISAGNSAAHYTTAAGSFRWTRPGIMLYGGEPLVDRSSKELGLEAVMTLESRLVAVRELQPGETVGYGADWRATEATRMGVVAIGYGDGYPRHAPSGTPVGIRNRRTGLIGRVSMDMLAIDLGDLPEAAVGDRVELWGEQIPIDEVARAAGTIGYELLTGVTARVPRVYLPAEEAG